MNLPPHRTRASPPLTDAERQAIREYRRAHPDSILREVAAVFGVSQSTVHKHLQDARYATASVPARPSANRGPGDVDAADGEPELFTDRLEDFWKIVRENLAYADAILGEVRESQKNLETGVDSLSPGV